MPTPIKVSTKKEGENIRKYKSLLLEFYRGLKENHPEVYDDAITYEVWMSAAGLPSKFTIVNFDNQIKE